MKYEAEAGVDTWRWSYHAIMTVGPDVADHMCKLPMENDSGAAAVVRMFSPLPPTRMAMWACLMGIAFKQVPKALEAWQSGRVPVEVFIEHAERLKQEHGMTPHIQFVWQSIVESAR